MRTTTILTHVSNRLTAARRCLLPHLPPPSSVMLRMPMASFVTSNSCLLYAEMRSSGSVLLRICMHAHASSSIDTASRTYRSEGKHSSKIIQAELTNARKNNFLAQQGVSGVSVSVSGVSK